ncbi:MAG: hypothetical protein GXP63_06800 [DPANN group archaeon]|nr:hypothetical protein [DPANN group archaeon]
MEQKTLWIGLVLISILLVSVVPMMMPGMDRETYVDGMDQFRQDLMSQGKFRCCLEEPCSYCLKKEEGCECMDKLFDGKHPCGECIGEILEGHGNRFLTKYFASAIAEKVGEQHLDDLKLIISEKYGVAVDEQV